MATQPDATLVELGARLDRPFGTSTVDLWLRKLGLSYKKNAGRAEQNRPDVAERRAHWHERLAGNPTARLVFVDESGANAKMTRFRGRAPVGQRLTARSLTDIIRPPPCVCHWFKRALAPCLFEGAMDGEMFLAWIGRGLTAESPGNLVIMDNLATHKVSGVHQAIEEAGPGWSICRPTHRISTPSRICGARSSRACAAKRRARRRNCSQRRRTPLKPSPPPTVGASF